MAQRPGVDQIAYLQQVAANLRATSRGVAVEIRKRKQRERRQTTAAGQMLTPREQLVVIAIMARGADPTSACMSYVLHRTGYLGTTASDQPRVHQVRVMVETFLRDQSHRVDAFAGTPDTWTSSLRNAWNTAGNHLAEQGLAAWTVECNTRIRCAPTSAQLREQWQRQRDLFQCSSGRSHATRSADRSARKALRCWRRRWGFRLGKMTLRDHFADGELVGKAPTWGDAIVLFFISCTKMRRAFRVRV